MCEYVEKETQYTVKHIHKPKAWRYQSEFKALSKDKLSISNNSTLIMI